MLDIGRGTEPKAGLRVLDLACGQGVLCRKLAAAGGGRCRVTGVDAAEALIAAAKEREARDGMGIAYRVADVTKLADEEGKLGAGLEAGSFDAVAIVLAVQNMTPLSPVWRACRAALKARGRLVIAMMHPCFRVPQRSDWLWEAGVDGGTQSRIVRRYLSSESIEIQTHPGLAAHGKDAAATTHFHRPLQAYVNTLGNAGLLIDHIEEWTSHKTSEAGPRKAALDRARKEIPMFLALRAIKV
jgi:2-polyprenyl-3-methyl-5-hydroxy-6-metoxy-1,4-benzoquinol methylase